MVRALQGCISISSWDLSCSQHHRSSAGKTGGQSRHRAAAEDAEMPPVVCAQKYKNIWAASCSCLFQKAKQNGCEINLYQQQDEEIYRKIKYRMGKRGSHWRACEGVGLHLGGVCYAVCIHMHSACKENIIKNYINLCTYKHTARP